MCGILGLYYKDASFLLEESGKKELDRVNSMLNTLLFRGPDDQNIVSFGSSILGHSRLSIIDLATGNQPIYNEDHSVAVVFNGEIYNFWSLRVNLEKKGHTFRSSSDTEVIVHLYEEFGADLFSHLDGMFAIVLHDKKKNIFLAARDRMGEKPLLYWENRDKIIVASELKALLCYPDIQKNVNIDALSFFFSTMYIPAPHCIIEGVKKLPPSHFLCIKDGEVKIIQYWKPALDINWDISEIEVMDTFIELFSKAVLSRKVADVPLGVFLSGGIDSSAVTALLALHGKVQIKTFAVGFAGQIDERPYARLVAERYGTDHTELYVNDKIEDVILDVMQYFDEPFGDSSSIPTYMVSKAAREHVKVVLTGDGGDELFAGYSSYLDQRSLWGGRVRTKLYKTANRFLLKQLGLPWLDGIYAKAGNPQAFEHWLGVRAIMSMEEHSKFVLGSKIDPDIFFKDNRWLNFSGQDPMTIAFSHDINFYLPDDLLKKVDMSSMLASIECRAPFLDHHLVEFAMTIPPQMKVKGGELKYILKKSLMPYLPNEILFRAKTGFGAPVSSWMRGNLKDMVLSLLQPGCLSEAYLNRRGLKELIENFYVREMQDYRTAFKLWMLFVFELWLQNYMKPNSI